MSQQELAHQIEQQKWKGLMMDMDIKRETNAMRKQELVQQRIALNHTITMDERQYDLTKQQAEWQMGEELEDARNEPSPEQEAEAASVPDTTSKAANSTTAEKNPEPRGNKSMAKKPVSKKPMGKRIASTPKLSGEDKAGVIARGNYGAVPFEEG
jgi:hypothetical protein